MDLVKKLSKENPGKPLGAILPLAKRFIERRRTQLSRQSPKRLARLAEELRARDAHRIKEECKCIYYNT
jgi:hypothetical protein